MRPLVALAALAVLASGLAAAQEGEPVAGKTSRVTFYGHIFNTGLDFPMPANTQFPWGEADFATSGPIDDTHCGPEPAMVPCDDQHNTKLVLFTTAGPVTVKQARDFDYAKLHNEFGMSEDVVFDTTQNVNATLFITPASYHGWLHNPQETPCLGGDPPENVPCLYPYWRWHWGVTPNFEVKAWLYAIELGAHGENAATRPPIREKLGEATLIAHGATQPENMISLDGYAGYPRVHKIEIDLGAPQVQRVSRDANLVMVFSWNIDAGATEAMADTWRINSGEFFPTSFTVPVKNAFRITSLQPAMIHDKVVVLGTMNTPWGSYDVDPGSLDLTIERKDGSPVTVESIRRVGEFQVAHGAHYKPVNVTYVWDWRADGAKPGDYVVRLGASNYQHSASDAREATFTLTADGRVFADGAAPDAAGEDLAPAEASAAGGGAEDERLLPVPAFAALAAAALAAVLGGRRR